ncbi:uncharacterized protein LOC144663449 isoform X2 [Oculina patagonica]
MTCFHFGLVLVMFLTCHHEKRVFGEVPCIKKKFVKPVEDKALINHVISTPTVTSEEVCKIQCFIEVKCESYNFGPKEGGGHVCELSDSDAFRDPLDWITKQGFLYGETQNPCAKAKCPVNARCSSDFENDTYLCACLTGFAGNNCEVFHLCYSLDVNECKDGLHGCHSNATCNNTIGSYNCTCKPGFHGNGRNSCEVLFQCSPSWIAFQSSCYKLFTDEKDWDNANTSCVANGAQLVKIESADENDFIKKELLAGRVHYWIGLTDAETENYWKWSDGSKLAGYINWMSGEPNNYENEDCGEILKGNFHDALYDGEWGDDRCSRAKGYICEK